MNFSETFIRRPIATSLMMAAIALFGLVAYRSLPVSDLPNVDFPTLLVTASLPGASPDTMASAVATPLENQFSNISGLDSMTSTNSLGSTQVTLEFVLTKSLDGAAVDVQSAITQAARLLPHKHADAAHVHQGQSGRSADPLSRDHLAKRCRCGRWMNTPKRASPSAFRWSRASRRCRCWARRNTRCTRRWIRTCWRRARSASTKCRPRCRDWNVNLPTGSIIGPQRAFTLQATGQLMSAAQYRPLIVAYRNGSPVRLEELGNVIDSVEDDKTASWFYTKQGVERAIILGVQRQPGTNTISVTDAVKNLLPTFRAEIPASVKMDILYDRSDTIRESYKDVQFTMLLTLGLVVMVIFLFLRNVSATVIPALALPFSIIGTFAIMYLLHYSLDNLSMMALILSVGFVVDDAIVMLENIFRHMEMGEKPLYAALAGSKEIGFTIVSMTLSLAAVFIPVLFLGGILGRLFREFSVTICVAILISGIVSVTLTPMLCSRFLRLAGGAEAVLVLPHHGAVFRSSAARLRPHAANRAAASRPHHGGVAAWCWPGPSIMFIQDSERLHSRSGHRPDLRRHRSRAGHFVLPDGGLSEARRRGVSHQSRCAGLDVHRGRHVRLHAGRSQLRRAGGAPEAALGPQAAWSTTLSRIYARSFPISPECAYICRIRPPSASAARSPRACISSPCSRPTKKSCTPARRSCNMRSKSCPTLRT